MALGKHNVRVQCAGGQDCPGARQRAGGAGHRLCARGQRRAAGGASEIPRHDHCAAGRVRARPSNTPRRASSSPASATSSFSATMAATKRIDEAVAQRLDREWAATPVRAYALTEYYRASEDEFGQLLKSKGYSEAEIGTHAGLLDTSLMMATDPSLVRTDLLGETKPGDGTHGDPRHVERGTRPARRRSDRDAHRRRDQNRYRPPLRPSSCAARHQPSFSHLLFGGFLAPADPPLVPHRPVDRPACWRSAPGSADCRSGPPSGVQDGFGRCARPPRRSCTWRNPRPRRRPRRTRPRRLRAAASSGAAPRADPDRAGNAAGPEPGQPLQRGRGQHAEPGRGRRVAARLCAEFAVQRRLCDRSGDPQGGRSLSGRVPSAARRPGLGPADPVGRQ